MYVIAAIAIVIAVIIGLVRAFRGPTLYDRILAANMVGAQTVLLVAVIGFLTGRPEFLGSRQTPPGHPLQARTPLPALDGLPHRAAAEERRLNPHI